MATRTEKPSSNADWSRKVAEFGRRLELYTSDRDEVLDALSGAFRGPRPDASLLSAADTALLEGIGVASRSSSSLQRGELAGSFAALVSSSLTVEEFAHAIGVTPSRIRQRLNHGHSLWGFKTGPRHQWRLPAWEILGDQLLPGVEALARAIPRDMHPVAVDRLVHTPNPDLVIDDRAVSVLEWLSAGNDDELAAASIGDPVSLA